MKEIQPVNAQLSFIMLDHSIQFFLRDLSTVCPCPSRCLYFI